jgi:hypothetical protein
MLPVVSARNSHLLKVFAPGILMFLDASGCFWLETSCVLFLGGCDVLVMVHGCDQLLERLE